MQLFLHELWLITNIKNYYNRNLIGRTEISKLSSGNNLLLVKQLESRQFKKTFHRIMEILTMTNSNRT